MQLRSDKIRLTLTRRPLRGLLALVTTSVTSAIGVNIPANRCAAVSLAGTGSGWFPIQERGTLACSGGPNISGVAGSSRASPNEDQMWVRVGPGTYPFQFVEGGL